VRKPQFTAHLSTKLDAAQNRAESSVKTNHKGTHTPFV
jgi:hypothetical protein